MTDENLDVILYIDEAQAPLSSGQRISGKIVALVPMSRSPENRDGVLQPGKDAPSFLQGNSLYITPRYKGQTWDDFRAGKEIIVNVGLLDKEKNVLARGIGSAQRPSR